eukprot:1939406-Prymnesium_polylepis.2
MTRLMLIATLVTLPTTHALPKVLCLHGGGESASGFQSQPGMASLVSDLSCNIRHDSNPGGLVPTSGTAQTQEGLLLAQPPL